MVIEGIKAGVDENTTIDYEFMDTKRFRTDEWLNMFHDMLKYHLRSLFAIGFQGFLIMICVGIYAVLIQSIAFSDDIIGSIWGVMGYTVLLCFTLFKTGSLAKGVFSAH